MSDADEFVLSEPPSAVDKAVRKAMDKAERFARTRKGRARREAFRLAMHVLEDPMVARFMKAFDAELLDVRKLLRSRDGIPT
jgi:hypothetical protein